MKYQIIGKDIEVTDGIRNVLEKKLSRLEKYFVIKDDVSCRAVVRSYKIGAKVEITIFTPNMDFRAEVQDKDLYAAFDLAIDKLQGQMRKLKTRMDRHKANSLSLGEYVNLENIKLDKEEERNEEVVRTKSIHLKPMTIDEAITKMEAIDHDFFMYLDVEDNKITTLYRRKAGGYGILQAENKIA